MGLIDASRAKYHHRHAGLLVAGGLRAEGHGPRFIGADQGFDQRLGGGVVLGDEGRGCARHPGIDGRLGKFIAHVAEQAVRVVVEARDHVVGTTAGHCTNFPFESAFTGHDVDLLAAVDCAYIDGAERGARAFQKVG